METVKDSSGIIGKTKSNLIAILLLLVIVTGSTAGFLFYRYTKIKKDLANASSIDGQKQITKQETDDLLKKVRALIVLPEGEEPVIATVIDKEVLAKNQPFYENAHNGDRVIAYMNARKAFIYDPINNKIVNAGPIYIDNTATSTPSKK